MNLLCLKYNNYFNRIIKKEDTLDDYTSGRSFKYFSNIAFNPNDGISATQIINWNENWTADYLIVFNDDDTVVSRWFILTNTRTRANQYRLTLKRDLIADNYNKIINETPVLIEKGYVGNNDPAVFNNEGMVFNQIKTNQTLLYDKSKCPWIVGYIPQDTDFENSITVKLNVKETIPDKYYENTAAFQNAPFYRFIANDYKGMPYNIRLKTNFTFQIGTTQFYYRSAVYSYDERRTYTEARTTGQSCFTTTSSNDPIYSGTGAIKNTIIIPNSVYSGNEYLSEDNLLSWNNKIIQVGLSTYYKITVEEQSVNEQDDSYTGTNWQTIYDRLTMGNKLYTRTNEGIHAVYNYKIYRVFATTVNDQATIAIPSANDRLHLDDEPFDMFCMPYSNEITFHNGSENITSNLELNVATAQAIALAAGSSTVYDLQLVPYCPIQEMIESDGSLNVNRVAKTSIVSTDTGNPTIGFILWCRKSNINFSIEHTITIDDYKISNECDLYRLCSGNWAANFEFSPAKNNGVSGFEIELSYKPYQPYIHVSPIFNDGSMYGNNFNDCRGLIYNGDMSLPQVSSAWANYQLSNKNYENIFNRQMQSMDVSNDIAKQQANFSLLSGVVSGTVSGAMTGASAGPWGMVAGAVGGAATSTVGGVMDYNNMIRQQEEQKSYTTDMFKYNLQNIQALPQTITKLGALTNNNVIVPVIEFYTCTNEEKDMFRNVLKYNGMTINRVGFIKDYLNANEEYSYIKGKVMRILDIADDPQVCGEIYNEIIKGVYL